LFLGLSLFFGLVPDGAVVDSGQHHYPFVLDVDGWPDFNRLAL